MWTENEETLFLGKSEYVSPNLGDFHYYGFIMYTLRITKFLYLGQIAFLDSKLAYLIASSVFPFGFLLDISNSTCSKLNLSSPTSSFSNSKYPSSQLMTISFF